MIKMLESLDVNVGTVIAGSKEEIRKEKKRIYDRAYQKNWYIKNKEYKKKRRLAYYHKNKNEIWHKKMVNKHANNMYHNNFDFKLKRILRTRLIHALNGRLKHKTTMELLGCSVEELWNHLEKQFQPGMTKENHGLWQIDHIKPCVSFDLSKPEEQKKCFHFSNLQPLWAEENLKKGAKV